MLQRRGLRALWIPSLATFAGVYVATIITTGAVTANYDHPDWTDFGLSTIPLIGPWAIIGNEASKSVSYTTDFDTGLLVASGIVQAAAFTGLVVGLTMKPRREGASALAPPRWVVLPKVGRGYAGLTVTAVAF